MGGGGGAAGHSGAGLRQHGEIRHRDDPLRPWITVGGAVRLELFEHGGAGELDAGLLAQLTRRGLVEVFASEHEATGQRNLPRERLAPARDQQHAEHTVADRQHNEVDRHREDRERRAVELRPWSCVHTGEFMWSC